MLLNACDPKRTGVSKSLGPLQKHVWTLLMINIYAKYYTITALVIYRSWTDFPVGVSGLRLPEITKVVKRTIVYELFLLFLHLQAVTCVHEIGIYPLIPMAPIVFMYLA